MKQHLILFLLSSSMLHCAANEKAPASESWADIMEREQPLDHKSAWASSSSSSSSQPQARRQHDQRSSWASPSSFSSSHETPKYKDRSSRPRWRSQPKEFRQKPAATYSHSSSSSDAPAQKPDLELISKMLHQQACRAGIFNKKIERNLHQMMAALKRIETGMTLLDTRITRVEQTAIAIQQKQDQTSESIVS